MIFTDLLKQNFEGDTGHGTVALQSSLQTFGLIMRPKAQGFQFIYGLEQEKDVYVGFGTIFLTKGDIGSIIVKSPGMGQICTSYDASLIFVRDTIHRGRLVFELVRLFGLRNIFPWGFCRAFPIHGLTNPEIMVRLWVSTLRETK